MLLAGAVAIKKASGRCGQHQPDGHGACTRSHMLRGLPVRLCPVLLLPGRGLCVTGSSPDTYTRPEDRSIRQRSASNSKTMKRLMRPTPSPFREYAPCQRMERPRNACFLPCRDKEGNARQDAPPRWAAWPGHLPGRGKQRGVTGFNESTSYACSRLLFLYVITIYYTIISPNFP